MGRIIPYEENHKISEDGELLKKCSIHDIYSPEDESPWFPCTEEYFYKTKANKKDGLNTWCKKCSSRKSRKNQLDNPKRTAETLARWHINHRDFVINRLVNWREDNHDHKREYEKDYYVNNPEKFKEYTKNHRTHDISKKEWDGCLKVFSYKCAYCGLTEEESKKIYKEKLHKDHVDHEGRNDLSNGIPACKSCNSLKHISDMEQWYRKQDFFSERKLQFIKRWITDGYKQYIENKLPYRIIREKDEGLNTYHFNLWTVDEKRNTIEIIATKKKKKDLEKDINKYLNSL